MESGPVRLMVDGEEVRLIDTIRLFQRDPLPGGHRYHLAIVDPHRSLGIAPCPPRRLQSSRQPSGPSTALPQPSRVNLLSERATS
jgi:hypothetical protein